MSKVHPTATAKGPPPLRYDVVSKEPFRRDFVEAQEIVEGYPVTLERLPELDVNGHSLMKQLQRHPNLSGISKVQTGTVWFFPDEEHKKRALDLIGA